MEKKKKKKIPAARVGFIGPTRSTGNRLFFSVAPADCTNVLMLHKASLEFLNLIKWLVMICSLMLRSGIP